MDFSSQHSLPVLSPAGWLVKKTWGLGVEDFPLAGVWGFSIDWGLGLWDGVRGLGWGFKHGSPFSVFKKSRDFNT